MKALNHKSLQASLQLNLFSKFYSLKGASCQVGTVIGVSEIVPGNSRLPNLVLFLPKQVSPRDQIPVHSLKCFKIYILQLITFCTHLQNT